MCPAIVAGVFGGAAALVTSSEVRVCPDRNDLMHGAKPRPLSSAPPPGQVRGPLDGRIVSAKALFDVAGMVNYLGLGAAACIAAHRAGCGDRSAATSDGAIIVGKMTEFAFSALGTNPHDGAPGNPRDRKRAPGGSSVEDDVTFHEFNGLVLRNPRVANLLDCPSVSLPLPTDGSPVGLMLIGRKNSDRHLLEIASRIETIL